MIRKAAFVAISIAAFASILYVRNATPRPPPVTAAEAARGTRWR